MVELIQSALDERGIEDRVVAAGQFNPRGHTGGLFVGGLAGGEVGGLVGGLAESVGTGVGSLEGMRAADAASGLPAKMLVGSPPRPSMASLRPPDTPRPTALAFQVPRASLTAKVHRRVNVRVLELIEDGGDHVSSSRATDCR